MSRPLFDALSDRLIFLNPQGAILFANQSGRDALDNSLAGIERHPVLTAVLRELAAGRRQVPLTLTLELINASGSQTIAASLAAAPNGRDLVLILPGANSEAEIRTAIGSFLDLVRTQLHEPMRDLGRRCARLEEQETIESGISDLAGDISGKLGKLLDLIEVTGRDALVGDDRVLLVPLLRELLEELSPQATRYRITVMTNGLADDMPPVYGSRDWIKRALRECIENAYRHSREDCGPQAEITVELRARQEPEHVLLQIINQGACPFGLPGGTATPFLAQGQAPAKPGRRDGLSAAPRPSTGSLSQGAAAAPQGLRIGLSLAQKIVELHEGHLRFTRTDDDMTEVRIELPTGGLRRRNEHLDALQAQRYAQDLASLLARRKSAPA